MINRSIDKKLAARIVLYIIMFLVIAGLGIVLPFLPFYARDLGATGFQMGLVTALFSLGQVVAAPLWGRLSDHIGRKPVLLIGLLGYAVSFFLTITASTINALLLLRLLGGLISASAFPTAQAYLVDLTSAEDRGHAIGQMGAAANLGFLFGPVLGGVLARWGPEMAFSASGLTIAATAVLGMFTLPASVHAHSDKQQRRIDKAALRSAVVGRESTLLWTTLLFSLGTSSMYSILGYYMIERYGAQTTDTAMVYSIMGGVSVLIQAAVVGRAIDQLGEDIVAIASLVLGTLGFIGLGLAPTVSILQLWVAVIAISMALVRPSLLTALSKRTHVGQGLTMGLQGSFDSFGRLMGPLWAGWAFGLALSLPYWTSAAALGLAAGVQCIALKSLPKDPTP